MAREYDYRPPSKETLQRKASSRGGEGGFIQSAVRVYATKKGNNWIRVLPQLGDADFYGLEVGVHFGIGPDNGSVLCLARMKKERCPVCEERVKAEADGDKERARDLRIVKRTLMWVVDRTDESKGPMVYPAPYTLAQDIAKLQTDPITGEVYHVDDPWEGYDITFEKEGDGRNTTYSGVRLARRPSSVDEQDLDYIEKNPLPTVLDWRTYEEVLAMFHGISIDEAEDLAKERLGRGRMRSEPIVRHRDDAAPRRDRDPEPPRRREPEPPPRRREPEPERSRTARAIDDDVPYDKWEAERARGRNGADTDPPPRRAAPAEEDAPPRRRPPEPEEPPRRRPAPEPEEEARPARRARAPEPEDVEPERPARRREPEPEPEEAPPPRRRVAAAEDEAPPPRRAREPEPDDNPLPAGSRAVAGSVASRLRENYPKRG